jgi:hypothetical protein
MPMRPCPCFILMPPSPGASWVVGLRGLTSVHCTCAAAWQTPLSRYSTCPVIRNASHLCERPSTAFQLGLQAYSGRFRRVTGWASPPPAPSTEPKPPPNCRQGCLYKGTFLEPCPAGKTTEEEPRLGPIRLAPRWIVDVISTLGALGCLSRWLRAKRGLALSVLAQTRRGCDLQGLIRTW